MLLLAGINTLGPHWVELDRLVQAGNFLTGDSCGAYRVLARVADWYILCILSSTAVITCELVIKSDGSNPLLDMEYLQGVNRGHNFFKIWASPGCSNYSASPLQ